MSTQPTVLEQLIYLQLQEAQQHKPVRFRFIQSLIQRALGERETVRHRLLTKAQQALDDYCKTMALPQSSGNNHNNNKPKTPSPFVELLKELADPKQNDRQSATASFTQQLRQQEQALLNTYAVESHDNKPSEPSVLRASKTHQKLQAKKRLDHFIDKALKQTPEDPGPLNPEMLVIRLLKHTRDLSPEYLSRYVSYFETLQCLTKLK